MNFGPASKQPAVAVRPDEALPASSAPPASPAVSQRLTQSTLDSTPPAADHELLRVIGRGSYGEVWLARHTRLGTLRAVKIIRRDNFDDPRPFQREFDGIHLYEPISRGHPNLVNILHVGGTDECFYYVMELADDGGEMKKEEGRMKKDSSPPGDISNSSFNIHPSYFPKTLRSELKQHGPLPIDRCLQIAHALASALAHLHANGLVHRDVKPSNVIFVGGVAKLADIGLVAGVDDARSFVGTEGYIPPEGPGTPSADCYSLGKLLYELSTGHDRTAWPEPPADLATRPDRERLLELNAILHRACAPDPRQRYATAETMLAEVALLQRGQSVKRKRTQAQHWAVCKKLALATVVLAFVATLGLIGLRQFESRPNQSRLQPSTNHEATILCDKARRIIQADQHQRYGFAWSNLNAAVQLDTNFTAAYALMSQMAIGESWAINLEDRMLTLRQLSSRLMTLDNNLAESRCAESYVQFLDWEFENAKKSIRQAIKLNPDCWLAHSLYGFYLCLWGHAERSRRELEIAEKLSPSFAINQFCLGMPFYLEGNYDAAAKQFHEALRLNEKLPWAHYYLGLVHQIKHDYPIAIEEFRKTEISFDGNEPKATERARQLQAAFEKDGESGYWQKCLDLEQVKSYPDPYSLACIYVQLGEKYKAINWLRKSIPTRQSGDGEVRLMLQFDKCWIGMRTDPEFKKLVAEMKFP